MNIKTFTLIATLATAAGLAAAPAVAQTNPQGGTGSGEATSNLPKDGGKGMASGMAGTSARKGSNSTGSMSKGSMGSSGTPSGDSSTGTTGNTGASGGAGAGAMGASGQGSLKTTPGSMPAAR